MASYKVGIDLGTTHTALARVVDAPSGPGSTAVETVPVTQLVDASAIDQRSLLPSFVYFAAQSEGALTLPWDQERRYAVGYHARSRAAEAPGRVISSAKSWLSQAGSESAEQRLPVAAAEDVSGITALQASERVLQHLREAWRHDCGELGDLAEQDITLTVPASFDARARELTVRAARAVGLENLTLLEEPQAALYGLIASAGARWRELVKPRDVLLVIDVGGGTTDFSAIALLEENRELVPHRIAVGDHILLGGDNMDLALAHLLKRKIEAEGRALDAFQFASLSHACRNAKEQLFADETQERASVVIAGRGSKLLGTSLRVELTRPELQSLLVEGFFPQGAVDAHPMLRPRGALTQRGLHYASDPAITKHLAAFLSKQASALDSVGLESRASLLSPNLVLFNGGVFKARVLRERVLHTLNAWLSALGQPPARELPLDSLDLAVAHGAAYYGQARAHGGLRIRGGIARSYYVGIDSPMPAIPGFEPPASALCIAPFGMEEGSEAVALGTRLGLVVGEAVRFRFFGSTTRRTDQPGGVLDDCTAYDLTELAPVEVTLKAEGRETGSIVEVQLHACVSEVGTLGLSAVPVKPAHAGESWEVELDVRS